MNSEDKPILFYDGACSLCRKEITFYQKLDKNKRVVWNDISHERDVLKEYNITYEQAMREIHGIGHRGEILKGVDAFILIWHELPYFRYLAALINLCRLRPLLRFGYKRFANWRYSKQQCLISDKASTTNNGP